MAHKHSDSTGLPLIGAAILTAIWGVFTIFTLYHIVIAGGG